MENHGMSLTGWLEITMIGSSSWMPYTPQRVKGFDDDDDDEMEVSGQLCGGGWTALWR